MDLFCCCVGECFGVVIVLEEEGLFGCCMSEVVM